MVSRPIVVAVVCCCLVVSTATAGVVASAGQATISEPSTGADAATCFPADGYEFTIGNYGPEIKLILHFSLVTNLGGPGAFGVELTGSIGGPSIIELRTGVLFGGIDSVSNFLNDPFGPFSIVYQYSFEIPAFDGVSYETTDSPVDGPVDEATC